ncbi:unnamed protein product, partial [Cylicocyclus nassatus]
YEQDSAEDSKERSSLLLAKKVTPQIAHRKVQINQSIIFCNSTRRFELLTKKITEIGYSCYYIHSKMAQNIDTASSTISAKEIAVTWYARICSLAVSLFKLQMWSNFDFPRNAETYMHRIGRSGRFGHLGVATHHLRRLPYFASY